jgi:hypothetical protein
MQHSEMVAIANSEIQLTLVSLVAFLKRSYLRKIHVLRIPCCIQTTDWLTKGERKLRVAAMVRAESRHRKIAPKSISFPILNYKHTLHIGSHTCEWWTLTWHPPVRKPNGIQEESAPNKSRHPNLYTHKNILNRRDLIKIQRTQVLKSFQGSFDADIRRRLNQLIQNILYTQFKKYSKMNCNNTSISFSANNSKVLIFRISWSNGTLWISERGKHVT